MQFHTKPPLYRVIFILVRYNAIEILCFRIFQVALSKHLLLNLLIKYLISAIYALKYYQRAGLRRKCQIERK